MNDEQYNALAAARKYVISAVRQAKQQEALVALDGDIERIERAHHVTAEIEADLAKLDAVIDAEDRVLRERRDLNTEAREITEFKDLLPDDMALVLRSASQQFELYMPSWPGHHEMTTLEMFMALMLVKTNDFNFVESLVKEFELTSKH